MREIKFRAWDRERKEMRQVQLMDWSDWWVSTGSTWERNNPLEYGERNSFKDEDTNRHILMQYTGLKDCNGVEIYDGDIVEDEFDNRAKVTWNQTECQFDEIFDVTDDWKVIGNIYEHPHLSEDKA